MKVRMTTDWVCEIIKKIYTEPEFIPGKGEPHAFGHRHWEHEYRRRCIPG